MKVTCRVCGKEKEQGSRCDHGLSPLALADAPSRADNTNAWLKFIFIYIIIYISIFLYKNMQDTKGKQAAEIVKIQTATAKQQQ